VEAMNRYELQNAASKIEGYLVPRHPETADNAMERARAECLIHLRRQIECVEAITLPQIYDNLRHSCVSKA